MNNHKPPAPRRVLARRMLGAGAIAVVALSASAYLAWQAQSPAGAPAAGAGMMNETPSPASGTPATAGPGTAAPESPDSAAAPGSPGPLPAEQADTAVRKFLDASVAVDPAATGSTDRLTDAAAGAILAETQNDTQELEANGWRREGVATVEALTIVASDTAADPVAVVAQACVDSSAVRTLDADGQPIGPADGTAQRALNVFTLHYISGAWKVVARSFPDEFAC